MTLYLISNKGNRVFFNNKWNVNKNICLCSIVSYLQTLRISNKGFFFKIGFCIMCIWTCVSCITLLTAVHGFAWVDIYRCFSFDTLSAFQFLFQPSQSSMRGLGVTEQRNNCFLDIPSLIWLVDSSCWQQGNNVFNKAATRLVRSLTRFHFQRARFSDLRSLKGCSFKFRRCPNLRWLVYIYQKFFIVVFVFNFEPQETS